MRRQYDELALPPRLLLGAGPSNPDPRVLRALALPPLGPLDPLFTPILDEVQALARYAFRTRNLRTFPVLGTARAGLEAALASLIEDGDRVVVVVHGHYGARLAETARRYGAVVDTLDGHRAAAPTAGRRLPRARRAARRGRGGQPGRLRGERGCLGYQRLRRRPRRLPRRPGRPRAARLRRRRRGRTAQSHQPAAYELPRPRRPARL